MDKPLEDSRIVVAKLPGRFAKDPATGAPLKWPSIEGYNRYNVCSSAHGESKQLSPMVLGPVVLKDFGVEARVDKGVECPSEASCVENAWQFSKVWEGEEDKDGRPTQVWYRRRRDGFLQKKGQRHVKKGKGPNRNVALYSLWGVNKFRYVKARARIYCPIYASLVKKTTMYKRMERELSEGKNILLLDYDGYDKGEKTIYECFDDASRPFGHAFVLKALLQGCKPLPWEVEKYTKDDGMGEQ